MGGVLEFVWAGRWGIYFDAIEGPLNSMTLLRAPIMLHRILCANMPPHPVLIAIPVRSAMRDGMDV